MMQTAGFWAGFLARIITNCWLVLLAMALLIGPAVTVFIWVLRHALAFVYFFSGGGPA